jgi:hypothetical protein
MGIVNLYWYRIRKGHAGWGLGKNRTILEISQSFLKGRGSVAVLL